MAQYANPQQFGAPMGGDGTYMEQDEEWEREGLLDPAWEKQQQWRPLPCTMLNCHWCG